MRAAVFEKFQGPISVQQVTDPTPNIGGVVVKVKATGICRSDWHGWMGHDSDIELPHIPGHELAGTIEAIGKNVRNFKIGDRVTIPFVSGCGRCGQCLSGNHQICDHQSQPGFTHWGSFAEYVSLDYADINLVKIPNEIDEITASTLGCRFITAYRAIVAQGKVSGGQYVVIHGCGGVGLSAIMIANALGAQVIAIDINNDSLEFAKSLGAIATINGTKHSHLIEEIKSITHGGAHVSMDALGSTTTCFNSISSLRKQGKHLQVGLMTGDHINAKVPMGRIVADELEIIGSHGMQAFKYQEMLEMIKNGKLKPDKLIERTITLEEATHELPTMNSFKNKGVLVINSF